MTVREYFNQNIQIKIGDIVTFTNEDIVPNSIVFNGTMVNNLQAGSSRFQFSTKPSDKTNKIISYIDKLQTEVLIGKPNTSGTVIYTSIFKGYLSNKVSTDVKRYGFDAITFTIEDPTTGLLKSEVFPDSLVSHYIEGTLSNILDTYYKGINIDKTQVSEEFTVVGRVVKVGETLESLLKDICYELGYVYYWSGTVLQFKKLSSNTANTFTLDYSSLAANKTTAINISKTSRKYSAVRLEGDIYEEVSNVLIYRDISGSTDNTNCNIVIKAGEYYPPQSSTENPTIVKCEKDLDTGKEIINIEEITPTVLSSSSSLQSTLAIASNNTVSVCLYNPTSSDITVTRLECSAKVKRLASTDIVKVADKDDKAETFEKRLTCVHTKDSIENAANFLLNYYKYTDTSYVFYVLDNEDSVGSFNITSYPAFLNSSLVGHFGKLKDDVISGLNVDVFVTGIIIDTSTNLIKYQAMGYSEADFDKSIIRTNITLPDDPTQGPKGDKGDKGDQGPEGPQGPKGDPGTPASEKSFYITAKEVIINRRENTYVVGFEVYTYKYSETEVSLFKGQADIRYNGHSSTLETLSNPTITKLDSNSYRLSYSKVKTYVRSYYPVSIDYKVTANGGVSQHLEVSVVDSTVYNQYLGMVDSSPNITDTSRYFDGDTIFDKSSSTPRVLQNSEWVNINSSNLTDAQKSTMLSYSQKDILSTIPADSVTASDYAYFNTLITNTVIASQLTMTDLGIIQSQGVDSSSVGSDGYLTIQGYRLEGNAGNGKGVLRATSAYIEDIHGRDGTLTNITVEGELKGRYINTVAPSNETSTINYTYPSNQLYYNNYEMRKAIINSFPSEAIKKPSSRSWNLVYHDPASTMGTFGATSFDNVYFSYNPAQVEKWGIVDSITLNIWVADDDNIPNPSSSPLYPNSGYTLFEGNNYVLGAGVCNSATSSNFNYGGFNGSSVKKYCIITASILNNFSSLPLNVAVNASGTAVVGGTTLSGNLTIVRGANSITISKGSSSVVIPGVGGVVETALSVNITYNATKEGIETSSIYPSSTTSDLGSNGSKFRAAYVNEVKATDITANTATITTISGTTITGSAVWGAVAN